MRGWAATTLGSLHGEGEREGGRKEFRKPFSFRRAELAERIAEIFSRSKRRMGKGFVWAASRSLAAHREQPRASMGFWASGHTLGAGLRCHHPVLRDAESCVWASHLPSPPLNNICYNIGLVPFWRVSYSQPRWEQSRG